MITENRALFINQLRDNPLGREQYFGGGITDFLDPNKLCAIGCGAEAFGFDPVAYSNNPMVYCDTEEDPYELVKGELELPEEDLSFIWILNDLNELSYSVIADKLEDHWSAQ